MTEKRFSVGFDIGEDYPFYMLKDGENILFQSTSKIEVEEVCDLLNEQHEELILKDEYIKGYQLEVKRLHHLADAMSGVLREFGIFDVFDNEAIAEALNRFLE